MPSVTVVDPYRTVYPEHPLDLFDYETDWKEHADLQAGGDVFLSSDGNSSATLHGHIPQSRLRSFALWTLGYAVADDASPWKLRRLNPPTHPQLPFLRAKAFSWQAYKPHAAEDAATDPPIPGDPDPLNLLRLRSMHPRTAGQDFGGGAAAANDVAFTPFSKWYTNYQEAKVTVQFAQPRYRLLEDSAMSGLDEDSRNVWWTTEPAADILQIEGGVKSQAFWREASSTGPTRATNIPQNAAAAVTPATSAIVAPFGYIDCKTLDVATWVQVPEQFIFDDNLIPTKILTCLGKTNLTDWGGYAKGTALLLGVSFEAMPWPIYVVDFPPAFLWNVKYHFKIYDPPRRSDADVTPAPGGNGPRGWRTFRYQDGFSYWVTRHNGDEYFGQAEFRNLFRHREAP